MSTSVSWGGISSPPRSQRGQSQRSNALSFSDPQSINIGAGAVSLPRVSVGANTSTYTSADGNLQFLIANSYSNRTRRTARLNVKKTAADPLFPAQNAPYSMSFYVVWDVPTTGFSVAECVAIGSGLLTNLTAATNANLTKIVNGEN